VADVFLSYAREDLSRATMLASALESRGLSVWWDRRIPAGLDFADYIEKQAQAAHCIVVLWSKASRASRFVKDEAAIGLSSNRLVPVLIESGVQQPMGFRQVQAADLGDWNGRPDSEAFESLVASIRAISPPLEAETSGPAGSPHVANHDGVRHEAPPARRPGSAGRLQTTFRRPVIIAVAMTVVVGAGAWVSWVSFKGAEQTNLPKTVPSGTTGVAAGSNRIEISRGEALKVRVDVGDMAVPYTVTVAGQVKIKSLTSREETIADLRPGDNLLSWAFTHTQKGWHHKLSVVVGAGAPVVLDQRSDAAGDSSSSIGVAVLVVGK
jgi:hypothetical protein